MKRIYIYYNKVCLLLVAVLMGTLMMSCERDNEVTPLPKEKVKRYVKICLTRVKGDGFMVNL